MRAKRISCLCILLLFAVGISSTCQAKSVFAITQHSTDINGADERGPFVKAYRIDGNEIEYQETIDKSTFGYGPVGITVSEAWDMIFITYESDSRIVCISAKTLEKKLDYQTDVLNLAGIVADDENEKLYVVQRTTGKLYVYHWDIDNETLVLEEASESEDYYQLKDANDTNLNSYGLALDSVNDLLLVTDASDTVCCYETEGFTYSDEVQNANGRGAVGIAYNETGYLYTGGYAANNNYLVRVDVNDPNQFTNTIEIYVGATATGLAVDNETGYLYCTTHYNDVRVYDTDLVLQYTVTNTEAGPAGIAVGSAYKPADQIDLIKVDNIDPGDDPNCVADDDDITYTITVGPNGYEHQWVTVTDYLPVGVSYGNFNDPNYSFDDHTYTWQLGPLLATDSPIVLTLTVTVNEFAEPASLLENKVTVESDIAYRETFEYTDICCWGGDIIFVDINKPTGGSGASWTAAYNDLHDALARADLGCGDEIWVAKGTYSPGDDSVDSFVLPDGVSVYGGFAGNEASLDERDWITNRTVLTGGWINNDVVTMGDGTVLDGCVISKALRYGIYGEDVDFNIANCTIENNIEDGIRALRSNPSIYYCTIHNNGKDGVYASEAGNILRIENCKIHSNDENGINCYKSTATILNSEIHHNGTDTSGDYYGINFTSPSSKPLVRNCTIVNNRLYGIACPGYSTKKPIVVNCIVWGNNGATIHRQIRGYSEVTYSCVNDIEGEGNISMDPDFVYGDPNSMNLHLAWDSPCRDVGSNYAVDPNSAGLEEYDIDMQERINGGVTEGTVDIGSDEVTCSDLLSEFDENDDLIVNYIEFASFANSWGKTEADADWNSIHSNYNYVNVAGETQDVVNIADLDYWTYEWLWEPCWMEGNGSVYDRYIAPPEAAQQSSGGMPMGEENFFTSEEIIKFFESLLDDKDAMEVIDKKDLKEFIKSLESDLFTDLP